jgi:hypothetical protein
VWLSRARRCLARIGWSFLAVLAVPALAAAPSPEVRSLDRFLESNVKFCMKAPAVQCIDRGFAFADLDRNRHLSLAEAKETQAEVNRWVKANARRLPPQERERLVMGTLLLQTVGPEQLFRSYDANRDGELSRDELTADLRLDKRPLPEILSDPSSIDWNALSARAGEAAPLLKRLFQL